MNNEESGDFLPYRPQGNSFTLWAMKYRDMDTYPFIPYDAIFCWVGAGAAVHDHKLRELYGGFYI